MYSQQLRTPLHSKQMLEAKDTFLMRSLSSSLFYSIADMNKDALSAVENTSFIANAWSQRSFLMRSLSSSLLHSIADMNKDALSAAENTSSFNANTWSQRSFLMRSLSSSLLHFIADMNKDMLSVLRSPDRSHQLCNEACEEVEVKCSTRKWLHEKKSFDFKNDFAKLSFVWDPAHTQSSANVPVEIEPKV